MDDYRKGDKDDGEYDIDDNDIDDGDDDNELPVLWSRVAAHVHCETRVEAVIPLQAEAYLPMFPPASKEASRLRSWL